ncbi:hypothetical protein GBW32_19505 [Streptomyces tsukubensis]|nr:hypothetical protein GBW32_19505 [Streptomyces tsukubensis]
MPPKPAEFRETVLDAMEICFDCETPGNVVPLTDGLCDECAQFMDEDEGEDENEVDEGEGEEGGGRGVGAGSVAAVTSAASVPATFRPASSASPARSARSARVPIPAPGRGGGRSGGRSGDDDGPVVLGDVFQNVNLLRTLAGLDPKEDAQKDTAQKDSAQTRARRAAKR